MSFALSPLDITASSPYSTFSDAPDNFAKVAGPIIRKILPARELYHLGHTSKRPVIAIGGCSGVGKSYFADHLATYLTKQGVPAKVLKLDDFMEPDPVIGALQEIHPHFNYMQARACLQNIMDGQEILEKTTWDLSRAQPVKIPENYDLRGIEVLILEGEFALCDQETYDLLHFSDVRVLIDAEDADIIRWDWDRARALESTSFQEFSELRTSSLARYRELLNPLKPHADFVISQDSSHEYLMESFSKT